jgi:hypothetical protein
MHCSFGHSKWGQFYTEDSVVEGFLFRSPSSATSRKPTTREEPLRGGRFNKFKSGWTLNLYSEKRSFNIDVPSEPNLYSKARCIGSQIGYQF